nr:Hsp20/alpha crystallin family protein [Eubacterium sp. AF05-24]
MMMRFLPGLFNEGFDDMFHDVHNMKCDIKEKDGNYLLDIELPGYKKENIHMDLKDGYLTIQATRLNNEEERNEAGQIIRQERFSGSCSRSFYIGEGIRPEDIKAAYENGELKITVPKEPVKKVEETTFIPIE